MGSFYFLRINKKELGEYYIKKLGTLIVCRHGTNKPWSIGGFASHGCIRMRNHDVEELFEWVRIGTPVVIEGGRARLSRALKYKTVGPDVVLVQLKLKELGYLNDRADGIFGLQTAEAVKRFQQDHGLETNGTVGEETLAALGMTQ